ncbi:hypothetical protein CA234_09880 [Sphingomonas sp. ABOLE]|nr:hypothetical protein CA234_09880 [Sphingomonas sp. ABOLE]
MRFKIGSLLIETSDEGGQLIHSKASSPDAATNWLGKPLHTIFGIGLFKRARCRVEAVSVDTYENRTTVQFSAPLEEWRLPWARPWRLYGREM